MKKPLIFTLFSTLMLGAQHGNALAADAPVAKFAGAIVGNPQRAESGDTATGDSQGKAAAKYIGNGNSVGVYDIWFDEQTDNDGDGYADFPLSGNGRDHGCDGPGDADEHCVQGPSCFKCDNGHDDHNDGATDMDDAQCVDGRDNKENQ